MKLTKEELQNLYDDKIWFVSGEKVSSAAPVESPGVEEELSSVIEWQGPESGNVLFIVGKNDFADAVNQELLGKILGSIELGLDTARIGLVSGQPTVDDFEGLQGKNAVFFGIREAGSFTSMHNAPTLSTLQNDNDAKRALWEYLKSVK